MREARGAEARAAGESMRLDRFLWFARLAKTREVAKAMAAEGRLRIDGRAIDRAHASVRVGNILTFFKAGDVRVLRVEALPARRGPAPEAQACYRDLDTMPESANVSQEGEGN